MNPTGLCMCGCGQTAPIIARNCPRRGYVKGQHHDFVIGHNHHKANRYTVEDCGHGTPCWIWQLSTVGAGYGRFQVDGKKHLAHRWHYEQVHGQIPDGLELDHLCRQYRCVNPDHLEPVTHIENVRRGWAARRAAEEVAA